MRITDPKVVASPTVLKRRPIRCLCRMSIYCDKGEMRSPLARGNATGGLRASHGRRGKRRADDEDRLKLRSHRSDAGQGCPRIPLHDVVCVLVRQRLNSSLIPSLSGHSLAKHLSLRTPDLAINVGSGVTSQQRRASALARFRKIDAPGLRQRSRRFRLR